ncbi:MAG: type I pullulanase [Ruminococcus sp.]|nr:type I pullulanase [Ruminococcus sp.]
MRSTKKILASALAVCMLASSGVVSAFAAPAAGETGAATNPYAEAAHALDAEYSYDGDDLGANYSPEKTVFKLWSPNATEVTLNRFATGSDSEPGAKNLGSVQMTKLEQDDKFTGVWTATVTGDIVNTYYTYTVTAPNPVTGETQTAETQDVYSVATGVNGDRSMVCDLSKTNPEGWNSDKHVVLDKQTDSQVWEIHVKDFSWDENSGVSENNRGKYMAFTETGTTLNNEGQVSTCIDYLKQLGITTVQINPFYDFHTIDEAGDDDQFNWGYDPENYNVPEGSYSSNPYDGNVRIKECKSMIKALHDAGISVVMDVVYNHTYSCDKSDSCFQASVPYYYHRVMANGTFSNGSGCGNEVSSDFAMTRKYILDSCMYWINEYHIDGFRFDLMGLIDTETMNLLREQMDKVDTRLTVWGEGWTGGTSSYEKKTCTGATFYPAIQRFAAQLDSRIAFFNDEIRDGIKGKYDAITNRGFVAGNAEQFKGVARGARANTYGTTAWKAQAPEQCVTYAACHDNATLYDQLVASATKSSYGTRDDDAVRMSKSAAAVLNTSQGITFYLAGDEMARTKFGDTNSYKSSPEINKINWQNIVDYADLVSYYQGMIKIKNAFTPFTASDNSYAESFDFFGKNLSGMSNTMVYVATNDQEGEWKKMAVIHNGGSADANITVGDTSVTDWVVIADDKTAGLEKIKEVKGSKFAVPGRSSLIAVDKESFEAADLNDGRGTVVVNFVHENGTKLADSVTIKGELGTGYQTVPSAAVENIFVVKAVEGDATGVYSEEPKEVTYVYTNYVPESIQKYGDVDGNGVVNISDATELQKILAGISNRDKTNFDFDYNGSVNINDVTMLMKYLAGYSVSQGTVKVNHYYFDAEGSKKELTASTEIKGRVGDEFTTSKFKVMGYAIDEERYPAITSGKFRFGSTLNIDYYYKPGSLDVKLHLKHTTENWTPYLWIWGSTLKGVDSGNYTGGNWNTQPPAPLNPDTGWFEYGFTYSGSGTYNVIVTNNKASQTKDYKGFVDNELWIIIDDSKLDSGKYLDIYTENPEENPNAPKADFFFGN